MKSARTTVPSPLFSIVSAVYNVDRYLPDFLSSLAEQSYGIDNLDIVLVDDGSTDASLASCEEFAARYPRSVRVYSKANGGQGSARNLGLEQVRGEWVTFTDPDDFLDANYFHEVAAFLELADPGTQVVSTSLLNYVEATGRATSSHPLQHKFERGSRVIDLTAEPECIQMHCSSTLVRAALVHSHTLRFDERIRPTFEDSHFIARCLLATPQPMLGVVSTAQYNYRKRADVSSTVDVSSADPDKYTVVPRFGLLPLLEAARSNQGHVPAWVQNMVLYDLSWAFKDDAAVASQTGSLTPAVKAEFHELAAQILRFIERRTVEDFRLFPLSDELRFALTRGYTESPAHSPFIQLREFDAERSMVKLSYLFAGGLPAERVSIDGHQAAPFTAKTRAIEFFEREVASERILWVPITRDVTVALNGITVQIVDESGAVHELLPLEAASRMSASRLETIPEAFRHPAQSNTVRKRNGSRMLPPSLRRTALRESLLSLALHSRWVRSRFGSAWVFMDKDTLAGDNAEHLYRHALEHHPELNTWFVLKRTSPDWKRLRDDGFRMVAHGSRRWKLLLLSAEILASSHIDSYVVRPLSAQRFGEPRWKFVFLQHGVIQSDLSRWLNTKRVDLLVTSSIAEHESIVADHTPYAFTRKEAQPLGLPRHDRLRSKRAATAPGARDLLVVMPTWRKHLVEEAVRSPHDHGTAGGFEQTEYATKWIELLSSGSLHDVAGEHGLSIVFMPHPNMAEHLDTIPLPAGVRSFNHQEHDVQDVLARSALLITDYSSVAFDAAAIDVPVVYYQFDFESFHSGQHIARTGYFEYERDGFGPVRRSAGDVGSAAAEILRETSPGIYAERARHTFAHYDQKNSERVIAAMHLLLAPLLTPAPGRK